MRAYALPCDRCGEEVPVEGWAIHRGQLCKSSKEASVSEIEQLKAQRAEARATYAEKRAKLVALSRRVRQMQHERQAMRDAAIARIRERDQCSISAAKERTHSDDEYALFLRDLDTAELDLEAVRTAATLAEMDHAWTLRLLALAGDVEVAV